MSHALATQSQALRTCQICDKRKPETKSYFSVQLGNTGTLGWECLDCVRAAQQKAAMAELEHRSVAAFLAAPAASNGVNVPHTAELLEGMMRYFGGVSGFSSVLMKQYWDSPPGGRMRNGILEMVVRLAAKNTEQGGARKPMNLYSEEEIENEIKTRIDVAAASAYQKHLLEANNGESAQSPTHTDAAGGSADLGLPEREAIRADLGTGSEAHRVLAAIQANGTAATVS